MMLSLEEAIKHCEEVAEENECTAHSLTKDGWQEHFNDLSQEKEAEYKNVREEMANSCLECASEHRQLAEWLKELKWYREDTRFADLYERICIKRDDDREYFARTKDKTYITRIAEKEMFIHMMQDMMFDRYGVEEVNADDTKRCDN